MPKDEPIYNAVGRMIYGEDWVEECVHGMSLWLCADPITHYPPDNEMW